MKKMTALLLALMLPVYAGAETLSEQLGSPEHVTASFTSNTGKTVIGIGTRFVKDNFHFSKIALN